MKDRIENLIELVATVCEPWIKEKDGVIQFIDPLDKKEISAHYGASHVAVALTIYGKEKKDERILKKGEGLLYSVFERWDMSKALPDFHNDFNNFALCVLDSYTNNYHDMIEEIVLGTTDSKHDTVNWLPMRWYVNKCRYMWTQDKKYDDNCKACAEKIKKATFNDGFIDDRLPVGMSFNLQYDVATVAVMQFLRVCGEDLDISKETGALINAICPDGDINYLGRGTNQIFAWGLWIYLLASGNQSNIGEALKFLEDRLPVMLQNNNIMLNDHCGKDKYLWWDYHYCSVYTAHFLLWMVLAWKDIDKREIIPVFATDGSSGIHIYKDENMFVVTFDGRTEYLAERGPLIAAIWTKKSGVVCKGAFGPWQGSFGNNYIQPNVTLWNFAGLQRVRMETSHSNNRIINKLISRLRKRAKEEVMPVFIQPTIKIGESIQVTYSTSVECCFTIAKYTREANIKLFVDGEESKLNNSMKIRNQYGWVDVIQSSRHKGLKYVVVVE